MRTILQATLCGFDPEKVRVTKGEDKLSTFTTGKEERFSCKTCGTKVGSRCVRGACILIHLIIIAIELV